MKRSAVLILIILSLFYFAAEAQSALGKGSPQFRAIGGVSMGAYGAMNIGLGRPGFFNTIASLGGPLDMAYLLKFIAVDMLGNYDNPSPYPNRDTLIDMLKDLTISFGNPVYYNPLSTYYPPGVTAQDARVPTTLFNFIDDLNPSGRLPVITYEDPAPGDWVEVLLALDSNENGKRDSGEPILKQFYEPFTDTNGNGIYDPGEPFADTGLDGVPGTRDSGEGDGEFTYNPNHDNFFAEDPLSRTYSLSFADLQSLNLYIDAGTEDEFQFNIHADNFVETLNNRGLVFRVENGFPEDFPRISHFDEKRVYVRYPGGHVGFDKENIGLSFEQAKQGIEEAIVVANRFTTLFSFISDHFTGGDFGTNPLELLLYSSKMEVAYFTSPSLNKAMKFGIYLPPGYSRSRTKYYPVLYLLLGYNMSVDGMTNSSIKTVLDGLILTGEMQKMIIVIPDGLNYKNQRGHFFVNQIDQERGDKFKDYFFDLVTFIDTYYKTKSLEQIPTPTSTRDFDKDGKTDITIWKPSNGYWYIINSSDQNVTYFQWGAEGDIPVSGDYDGDGKADIAVWKPSNGYWYIINSSDQNVTYFQWGAEGDIPVSGDYDGDGKADIAVWRPSNGYWYIVRSSDQSVNYVQWGGEGDIPLTGDFDGDGKTDIVIWRPSNGYWYIINSSDQSVDYVQWGGQGDIPISGDFDGDGKADIAVWRPSNGYWYIINSSDQSVDYVQWGGEGDIPIPGDYDGDGKTDIVIYRPSNGYWYIIRSSNQIVDYVQWGGAPNDIPVSQ